jgi:hypothetical protein
MAQVFGSCENLYSTVVLFLIAQNFSIRVPDGLFIDIIARHPV